MTTKASPSLKKRCKVELDLEKKKLAAFSNRTVRFRIVQVKRSPQLLKQLIEADILAMRERDILKLIVGKVIRRLRSDRKLSSREAADRINIAAGNICDIENSYINISMFTLFRLAKCFQIMPHQLMEMLEAEKDHYDKTKRI